MATAPAAGAPAAAHPDPAHPPAAPKKGISARIWGLFGVVIVAGFGWIALTNTTGAITPMMFSGVISTIAGLFNGIVGILTTSNQGMTQTGTYLVSSTIAFRVMATGGVMLFVVIALYLILFFAGIMGIFAIVKKIRAGGNAGAHPPPAQPPAPPPAPHP